LKKCLTFFVFSLKTPFSWLWKAFFHPVLTLLYRVYRFFKKIITAQVLENGRLVNLFTRRHVINVAILLLTFLVTATNIQASNGPSRDDMSNQRSLLARMTKEMGEELLIEEADEVVEVNTDVSYLDGQALNIQDYYINTNSSEPSIAEEVYGADDLSDEAILPIYAVRSQAESAGQRELPPTRSSITEHVVEAGDTVETIAHEYGLQTQTVLQTNGLSARGLIRIGQKLRILPVDGVIYKTKKGDNLSKIASAYKSEVEKIVEINSLADAASLDAGMELVLPGGRLPPPPPAPKTASTAIYIPPTAFEGLGSGSLLWPAGSRRITQYYSRRHFGLDIGAPTGTPIYAVSDGSIIYSGWNSGGYGNMVIINHGGGLFTRYGHASKLLVKAGDEVKQGDTIALIGSTGRSTGPHLHFEVLKGDIYHRLNPLDFVK